MIVPRPETARARLLRVGAVMFAMAEDEAMPRCPILHFKKAIEALPDVTLLPGLAPEMRMVIDAALADEASNLKAIDEWIETFRESCRRVFATNAGRYHDQIGPPEMTEKQEEKMRAITYGLNLTYVRPHWIVTR